MLCLQGPFVVEKVRLGVRVLVPEPMLHLFVSLSNELGAVKP